MSEDRAFSRLVGGPVLLDGSGGVKVVPRCVIDGVSVDLNDPDRHVCIPVEGGETRKVKASEAAAEEMASRPARQAAADAEAAARPIEPTTEEA